MTLYIHTLPSHQYNLECCKKIWKKIIVIHTPTPDPDGTTYISQYSNYIIIEHALHSPGIFPYGMGSP